MFAAPSTEFIALQEELAGRYSLERELGRGGMGIVFLAHEVRLDRPVALKLLPPEYAAQPSLRRRFLAEARTAAKLSHPHIVPIHAVDEVGDFVYFVMAYVEGQTLGQRIRERGPVPPRETARILREVSWALGYAHAQGVIHRDVKPDNILLEAGTGRALVTDFGIAQVAEQPGVTDRHEVLGTAEFMSPEQASGDPIDARSDIYALGIVGHYMLSGRLPIQGATVAATLAKQITQAAPALADVAPEVPGDITGVVDRCLEKDPDARFAGADELADAFARAVEVRREVPASLRAFVNAFRDRMPGSGGALLLGAYFGFISIAMLVNGEPTWAWVGFGVMATLMAGAPPGMLVRMTRELIKAGHDRDELIRALRADIEARREEQASQFGSEPSRFDRVAVGLTWGGLGVAVAGTIASVFVTSVPAMIVSGMSLVLGAVTSVVAAPFALTGFSRRKGIPGSRWLKFWQSKLGDWTFGLARFRLKRAAAAAGSYRPTEMAISMAADRLFESLPKDLKKRFNDVPDVVHRLEGHAEAMRARIRELDEVLAGIDREGGHERARRIPGLDERRGSLKEQVRNARRAAEDRLAEVVASLESIRLELLRMQAGTGSVEGMTSDLSAAMALSSDIQRLVSGGREVDQLLGSEPPPTERELPTPA